MDMRPGTRSVSRGGLTAGRACAASVLAGAVLLEGCGAQRAAGEGAVPGCVEPGRPIQASLVERIVGGIREGHGGAGPGPRQIQFAGPTEVAASIDEIYVADAPRRVVFRVQRMMQTVAGFVAHSGDPRTGLFVDRDRTVYLGDPPNERVVRYDDRGTELQVYREPAALTQPVDVVVHRGRIYVADGLHAHIVVFSGLGGFVDVFGERVARGDPFSSINALAAGPDGLYALDPAARAVHVMDAEDGLHRYSLGGEMLGLPRGLAVDEFNRVFVADGAGETVRVFRRGLSQGQQGMELLTGSHFMRITDLWIDDAGRLYVADADGGSIDVFAVPPVCR